MSDTMTCDHVTVTYAVKELPSTEMPARTNIKNEDYEMLLSETYNISAEKEGTEFYTVDFAKLWKQEFYREINRRLAGD